MIVQCQKCQTKFKLPDSKVPPGGTKVRCGKCGSTFRVVPPAPQPAAEESTRIASSAVLEELEKKAAAQAATQAAAQRAAAAPPPPVAPRPRVPSKAFVPKNPFLDEQPPAPPKPAQPPPPPVEPDFNMDLGPDLAGPAAPPSPAPAPADDGLFGSETRVVTHESFKGAPPAPSRPLSGEKKEFVVPVVPHGKDPGFKPAPAPPPAQEAHADIDVDSLFSGLFVPDHQGAAPAASEAPSAPSMADAPFAGHEISVDPDSLNQMPVPEVDDPARARGGDRWADMGADLIGGSGIDPGTLGAAAPVETVAPPPAGPAPQEAGGDALAGVQAAFSDDLAKSLQDEINKQFEKHFGESPGMTPEADIQFDTAAVPQPTGFTGAQSPAPAGVPGTRQPITENPFAQPFAVGIGTNDLGAPAPASQPALPAAAFPALAAPADPFAGMGQSLPRVPSQPAIPAMPAMPAPSSRPSQPALPNLPSQSALPQLDAFGQPPGGQSNPFLQVPAPISSPSTMTAPPGPGSASSDFLPQIPAMPPPAAPNDPFASFDMSAPLGAQQAHGQGEQQPALSKFAAQAGQGTAPGNDSMAPGFSSRENDLFSQLESMGGDQGPGIGPQIEQLPVRQGETRDPAFAPSSGFDLDTGGAASFVQAAAGAPAVAAAAAAGGASGIDLHEGAVQQARPVIAKTQTTGPIKPVVAVRKELPKGPFARALPWIFTVLLLCAAVALLGLRNGKFAAAHVLQNLSPSSAGSLNKYTIQGFKLYTVKSGRKVGVVTGNVKAQGAVDPAVVKIGFSLADYAGFTAFKGDFFPAQPLTPEEIFELDSQEAAVKTLAGRRLKAATGGWIPFQAIFFDPPEHLERFAFHIDVIGVP